MATDQIQLDRIDTAASDTQRDIVAGVKTILLHVQNDKALDQTLESALSLARACDAHLDCLHVTPIQAYTSFDAFGGTFVMSEVIKSIDEEEKLLSERLSAKLRKEGVSWDYTQVTGDVASQIIGRAALADLVVTGRQPKRTAFQGPTIGLLGDLLHRSRTPLFIAADDGKLPDPNGRVLIAWNGSFEAANAVRSAVGLLRLASEVRVVRIDEQKDETFPSTRLLEYLSRQGINADLKVEVADPMPLDTDFAYACLMSEAERMEAGYVVMGGYGHSRVSEYMFGGLTRSVLGGCSVPLFIAH
ncbi:universal stress protein [Sphingomonas rhizophila]|uniref:Universal stress protein n=1 Tax=Sphingomonas rhizophila TaxID=2071607 RepID=A0A7G9S929_9SPHN|nr:universal stress protein [Sphingomonas rhizophila]QNN64354.1 universal stress protein [Sphingomonas rhizophila]